MNSKTFNTAAVVLAVAAALFTVSAPAHADSYQIYNLGNDNGRGLAGIDNSGAVVVWSGYSCGSSYTCFTTYIHGVQVGAPTGTAPNLIFDNGSTCRPAMPQNFDVAKGVCNNGREAFSAYTYPPGNEAMGARGLFEGNANSFSDIFVSGWADQIFMNSAGDIAWTDGQSDFMYEAVNVSSIPEPISLVLAASGFFVMFGAIRGKAHEQNNYGLSPLEHNE